MSLIGNLSTFDYKTCEWTLFKGWLTQFLKINDVKKEYKAGISITHLSNESYRLIRNLAYPKESDTLTFEELVSLLDQHFKAKKCSYSDRPKFYGAVRGPGENLGDWAARLRGLASYCDFGSALETVLTDRFILGLGPGPEREKLFKQDPSTLKIYRALELAEQASNAREARMMMAHQVKEEPMYRA